MKIQLQLDIYKGVPRNDQHKVQEEYESIAQGHGRTSEGLLHPKGEMSTWEPSAIKDLIREPMYGKALPFT